MSGGIEINLAGRVVGRSRNLAAFPAYARRLGRKMWGGSWGMVAMVGVYRPTVEAPARRPGAVARVVVTFRDGATGEAAFMDWRVATHWAEGFATRRGGAYVQDSGPRGFSGRSVPPARLGGA